MWNWPLYNRLPPFEIPADYTHRPFHDPANVGQKVKPNKGWQKVELGADPRLKPWKVSQPKPDRSILGKIGKLLVWPVRGMERAADRQPHRQHLGLDLGP